MYDVLHRLICNVVPYAAAMISGRHLGLQNCPILFFGIVIQLTRTIIWQVNYMLLLLLVACQYSLHNNIVIMCAMYKQTRNRDNETECDGEWTRKGLLQVIATWSATFAEFCALKNRCTSCALSSAVLLESALYTFVACSGRIC